MQKIAAFIVKKRKLLLVVMLALAVVCAALMPFVGINTDMTKYLPVSYTHLTLPTILLV